MKTITFFSYKGGVGRSLLLANIARYLALLNKRVFVIDFDLEAPGLHYKFALSGKGETAEVAPAQARGLLGYIAEFVQGLEKGSPPPSLREIVRQVPVANSHAIDFLPATRSVSHTGGVSFRLTGTTFSMCLARSVG